MLSSSIDQNCEGPSILLVASMVDSFVREYIFVCNFSRGALCCAGMSVLLQFMLIFFFGLFFFVIDAAFVRHFIYLLYSPLSSSDLLLLH